jgi:hypothetical protein
LLPQKYSSRISCSLEVWCNDKILLHEEDEQKSYYLCLVLSSETEKEIRCRPQSIVNLAPAVAEEDRIQQILLGDGDPFSRQTAVAFSQQLRAGRFNNPPSCHLLLFLLRLRLLVIIGISAVVSQKDFVRLSSLE